MTSNTFLIDIGNSSTCFVEHGKDFSTAQSISTKLLTQAFVQEHFADCVCVISSVVPEKESLFLICKSTYFVTYTSIKKLSLNVDSPEQVGADRLVNALAAYALYRVPCLILDSGTALTACLVDGEGVYQGGLIFPGMRLCSMALHEHTAKLPLVAVSPKEALVGKNTDEAVKVGLYRGFLSLINGLIGDFRRDIPGITVVGTGQGLIALKHNLDLDVYDEDLIFKGLSIIAGQHLDDSI